MQKYSHKAINSLAREQDKQYFLRMFSNGGDEFVPLCATTLPRLNWRERQIRKQKKEEKRKEKKP